MLCRNQTFAVMYQSYSAQGLVVVFVIMYFYHIIYSFLLMFWNSKDKIPSTCSLRFFGYQHFLVYDTQRSYIFFWMLETNIFIKDTTKILANISKHICKHNASLLNWQHFEKQYDKTTQLVSTLVQNPYIFDHITYVPT